MRAMNMINAEEFPLLYENQKTLKKLSEDENGSSHEYMTYSEQLAVDFDRVSTQYSGARGMVCSPKSNDALYMNNEGAWFIEFKNGRLSSGKIKELHIKNYESLLTLKDITKQSLQEIKGYLSYILVYNERKNPEENLDDNGISVSESREKIATLISRKGKREFVRFGLERFGQLYFKEVHTWTQAQFEAFLKDVV